MMECHPLQNRMAEKNAPNLTEFLNGRVEELRRLAPRALNSWERESIHQARVTTRRLKAALDLLEPVLVEESRRSFARVLRRLRRTLGPVRDVDVMLIHLEEYRDSPPVTDVVRWLNDQLQMRRAELRREAARTASTQSVLKGLGSWWAVESDLAEAEQAAASLAKRAIPRQLQSFVRRADRLTRLRENVTGEAHEDVHALRIDGKLLRYTLELSGPLALNVPQPLLKSFKQLQDALGLWHDFVVLGEQALRVALDQELPLHDPRLHGQVLELAHRCWRKSEQFLNRFADLWSKRGNAIREQVLASVGRSASSGPTAAQGNGHHSFPRAPTTAKMR
jgi:CHAD domain-containing protein